MNNQLFDYDHVEVVKVKYARQEIPEVAEENMELGGVYQEFIYKLGECLGCCRTYIPCCCCAQYPYKQVEQSFVGIGWVIFRVILKVWKICEDCWVRAPVLQPSH